MVTKNHRLNSSRESARPEIHIGIPAYDEAEWLPTTIAALECQTDRDFTLWVCVNQPRDMDRQPDGARIALANQVTLNWLRANRRRFSFPIEVIDAVQTGIAPPQREAGVGWARRHLFERILAARGDHILGISLDADTLLDPNYVAAVRAAFARYPNAVGLAAPYYHPLPPESMRALNLLRYELYLRAFQLGLWDAGSPYAFLALGSALAFRGASYRRAGGFPLRQAGEDFYLLQQLRKRGPIIRWIEARAWPAARVSQRVPFGTGILLGESGMAKQKLRYPFFHPSLFDMLGDTFRCFADLYERDLELPIHQFVVARMGGYGAFAKIRRNVADQRQFIKACHEKLDGLKTFQCLRFYRDLLGHGDEATQNLGAYLRRVGLFAPVPAFRVENLAELANLRDLLWARESECQQRFMASWDPRARW